MKIVVFACDLYSDIAPAFEYLFRHHWPDCPYETEYVTNSTPLSVDAKVHYYCGQDSRYGWRLRKYIDDHCKPNDLILLTMIDYLLKGAKPHLVKRAEELCLKPGIAHVRLRPMPPPSLPFGRDFGEVDKRKRYALSLQPGIWPAGLIYDLVQDNEDPWQVELRGTVRSRRVLAKYLCSRELALPHHNYYRKRKVSPGTVAWVKANVPEDRWPDAAKEKA